MSYLEQMVGERPKCKKCGKEMRIDDVDYNFKGNQDNYWTCDNCNIGCMEKIRYGKSIKKIWSEEK